MPSAGRVLMFAAPFPPRQAAGTLRTVRFVKYLREFGWAPLVITVCDVGRGTEDRRLLEQVPPEVVVERAHVVNPAELIRRARTRRSRPAVDPARPACVGRPAGHERAIVSGGVVPLAGRILAAVFESPDPTIGWLAPAVAAAWRLTRRHDPSVIYSTSPPHSSHLVALVASRLCGLPLVIDFRDPWARSPWRNEPGRRVGLHQRLEALCVRSADRVILNTGRARREFVTHYRDEPATKFAVIPNGFDPEQVTEISRLVGHAGNDCAPGAVRLCHPGTVYGRRDLRPVLRAVADLRRQGLDVRLEQVGTVAPSAADGLDRLVDELDLTGAVSFVPLVPHAEALRRTAAADVLLVLQPGTPLQVPGKLYEMMMFRKPLVVLADEGETADIVREHDLGRIADPDDVLAISSAIQIAAGRTGAPTTGGLPPFDGRTLTARLAALLDEVAHPEQVAPERRGRSLPGSELGCEDRA